MAKSSYPTNAQRAAILPKGSTISSPGWKEKAPILARHEKAKQLRMPWEAKFQECYDYAIPSKDAMFALAPGSDRVEMIYDETAMVGVQEFASRLQEGLVPAFSQWIYLRAGADVPPDQKAEVDAQLEAVTTYVFEVINSSNFAQEAVECFLDLAVGTACMSVQDGDDESLIVCKAIPISQLFIDKGADDRIGFNSRVRKEAVEDIRSIWPKAALSEELNRMIAEDGTKQIELIEAVYTDRTPAGEENHYCVLAPKQQAVLFEEVYKGSGSSPMITFRWSKMAGEVWGRGPLFNCMPAVRTCNLTVQLILENAEMAIGGFYTAEDDGVVNPDTITIQPGTIVPVGPGSKGLTPIAPASKFDVAQLILQDMRANIKRALYNEMLGNPENTPASATEVSVRMRDLSRQIGAAYGRLTSEFVFPFIRRVLFLLRRAGRIKLPSINHRVVKPTPNSPLSRAQAFDEVQNIDRFMTMVGQKFGPQLMNVFVKGEAAVPYIARKMEVPATLLRSPAEQRKIAETGMQMAQGGASNGNPSQTGAPSSGA